MLIANAMNTKSLVLNRFRSEVESHAVLIETGLALGAESEQTVAPYVQVSLQTFQTHLAPDGVTADRHWLFSPISRIREESDAS